jgi:integrase/recombinase XerD
MTEQTAFVSVFGSTVARFLAMKETMGRRYTTERAVLKRLDHFFATRDEDLSAETFAQWCQAQESLTSGVRRSRMRIVRNFCLYRRRAESSCFVPDLALFPPHHQGLQPHIFTEAEIGRLLRAADALGPAPGSPLRHEGLRLALVLFYTTGLRRGELLRLTIGDYAPDARTLLIRESKFHKFRLLPLSADASFHLEAYLQARRSQRLPVSGETALFGSPYCDGKPYTATGLRAGINLLLSAAGICTAAGRLPRLHDFRHTFAVHALMRWYRAGADVQAKLPFLATYMGHVSIASTHYYLPFVEQIADLANSRFADRYATLVTPRPSVAGGHP